MENEALTDIVDYAKKRLTSAYGYCGVAENPEMVMLNSDAGIGKDIKIVITIDSPEGT